MAEPIIVPADVILFAPELSEAKAIALIDDAVAWATIHAPCIVEDDFPSRTAAKGIIRRAILRINEEGSGALSSTQQTAGVYGITQTMDTRNRRSDGVFTEGEVADLARLCGSDPAAAFTITPYSQANEPLRQL